MFHAEIASVLTDEGVGFTSGERMNIFASTGAKIPAGDGPYLTMIETPGVPDEKTHNSLTVPAYVRPSMQISVRAATYDAAMTMLRAAYLALVDKRNTMIGGVFYRQIDLSQIFDLRPDELGRIRVAFNLSCIKRFS